MHDQVDGLSNWQSRVVDRSVERAAASPGDRRTPASVARRALRPTTGLVQAAIDLVNERGAATFTVQEVLVRANVSLQTFYRHFRGKDELLLAVIEEIVTISTDAFREEAASLDDPMARLEYIVKGPFRSATGRRTSPMIVREHLRLLENYAREVRAADDSYRELLRETIEAAQARGQVPGVDAAEESELIMSLVLTRYHGVVLGVAGRSTIDEAAQVWAFCMGALNRNDGGVRKASVGRSR